MDPHWRRRVLSDFYREEFLRHLEYLESSGGLSDSESESLARLCQRFTGDLDRVCGCAGFPAAAETLLQRFDALTGLSRLDPRRGH